MDYFFETSGKLLSEFPFTFYLDIPGFYYDEEKKKYFKITKDHPKPTKKQSKLSDEKMEVWQHFHLFVPCTG